VKELEAKKLKGESPKVRQSKRPLKFNTSCAKAMSEARQFRKVEAIVKTRWE
jgi:hypothetical protein